MSKKMLLVVAAIALGAVALYNVAKAMILLGLGAVLP